MTYQTIQQVELRLEEKRLASIPTGDKSRSGLNAEPFKMFGSLVGTIYHTEATVLQYAITAAFIA